MSGINVNKLSVKKKFLFLCWFKSCCGSRLPSSDVFLFFFWVCVCLQGELCQKDNNWLLSVNHSWLLLQGLMPEGTIIQTFVGNSQSQGLKAQSMKNLNKRFCTWGQIPCFYQNKPLKTAAFFSLVLWAEIADNNGKYFISNILVETKIPTSTSFTLDPVGLQPQRPRESPAAAVS